MKLWRVNSPFFILVGVIILYSISSVFGQQQTKITNSRQEIDSSSLYYALSDKDSLSFSKRLQYIASFLDRVYLDKQDSLIYLGLMRKTKLFGKIRSYDSAFVYSQKLYDLAQENRDTIYMIKAYTKLGLYHKKNNQLAEAFKYYNEAFKISRLVNDSIESGASLLQMSNIQVTLGDYSGSKTTAIDGVKYIENTPDIKRLSGLYHIISVSNLEQKNYNEALRYNQLALDLGSDSISSKIIGKNYMLVFKNTQANIFADQKNYKKAISILSGLKDNLVIQNNKYEYARVLDNLGHVKWLQNKENTESQKLLRDALKIRNEINDTGGLIASNIHLTKYYLDKEEESKALHFAEEAYKNALELKSLTSIIEALGFVFQLKDNTNEEAKVFNETYHKLSKINQSNREIYAVTKYENDKLTNENLILKAETAKKDREKIIYLFGTIILLLAAGLIFYLLQQRHKREKIRDVFNAETRISKKIHDELANDVYHVMNTIQNNTDDHEVLDRLEDIYSRTRDISRENSSFDIGENYAQELSGMLSSYSSYDTKIIIKDIDDINWQAVKPEKKIVIHRIIQELMINMKKHSQASLVAITFRKKGKKTAEISYADNGVGVDKNEIFYSNGLQNAENRINSIGGSFIFDSEKGKGFKAKIFFRVK
ncbi:tetratricopeptide repeat-containing sensor histidine kinase [Aquimarina mytili]|uniref:ATP-binding protein n=1 Tax=Aquimarina mytili TaxID=874423 RepID=A0A937A2Q2_9FLAO|nr:hypothetical protein [Aquimarina mytili]MBL0685786.1 hypothetical protein [Aquimarina mytili]